MSEHTDPRCRELIDPECGYCTCPKPAPITGALTREQVEEAIRLLKEKLPIEYWPGLVNLSDTDKYLREELRCERE